uniref:Uncharacterized protein n=1 Tax=Solanum tuberosum TaxID=4113 RepID=M1DRI5_SOLTU
MERTTSSATIGERHELHKKFLADCDQLTVEYQKWLNLIEISKKLEAERHELHKKFLADCDQLTVEYQKWLNLIEISKKLEA